MTHYPPPAPNWAGVDPTATRHRSGPGALAMMTVGALIFAVGCGSGLVVGWMAAAAQNVAGSLASLGGALNMNADAVVAVDRPDAVQVGDTFSLVVTVTDTRGEARSITDVDLVGALADQFEVISVDPSPSAHSAQYGYRSHTLNTPVDANASTTVTLSLKATAPGSHTGAVDVYMEDYNSISTPITILVTDPAQQRGSDDTGG